MPSPSECFENIDLKLDQAGIGGGDRRVEGHERLFRGEQVEIAHGSGHVLLMRDVRSSVNGRTNGILEKAGFIGVFDMVVHLDPGYRFHPNFFCPCRIFHASANGSASPYATLRTSNASGGAPSWDFVGDPTPDRRELGPVTESRATNSSVVPSSSMRPNAKPKPGSLSWQAARSAA